MNKLFLLAACWLIGTGQLIGQSVPSPGAPQERPVLLQNATIHIGNGEVIDRGDVLIIDGKISDVGVIRTRVEDAEVIDLAGKHLYPGLIAPCSQIGLDEIEAVRATDDRGEVGAINPNARAIVGYNTDSRVTPTIRSNGILLAQIAPARGRFAGTSSVVHLDAWNWEDAAYALDDAQHLYWPRMEIRKAWWAPPAEKQKENIEKQLRLLQAAMDDAKAYLQASEAGRLPRKDLRWEAMIPVLKGERPLFIHANSEKEILAAVAFSKQHQLKMVLVGGADAYLLTDLLKTNDVPVVLVKTHRLPAEEDDHIHQPYQDPKVLSEAGILTCLGMRDFWNTRNLPFQAGTAAAYGMDKEAALQLVTLNTAKILGIDDRTGSIETGKDANLLVSTGDLLDMRTSQVEMAWVQGRKLHLSNRQSDLYEKFKTKYSQQKP